MHSYHTPSRDQKACVGAFTVKLLKTTNELKAQLAETHSQGKDRGEDHNQLRTALHHHLASIAAIVNTLSELLEEGEHRTITTMSTISKINFVVVKEFSDTAKEKCFGLSEYINDLNIQYLDQQSGFNVVSAMQRGNSPESQECSRLLAILRNEVALFSGGLHLLDCRMSHTSAGNINLELKPELVPFEVINPNHESFAHYRHGPMHALPNARHRPRF